MFNKFEKVIVSGDPFWIDEIYKKDYKAYFISEDESEDGFVTLLVEHEKTGQWNTTKSISNLSKYRIEQGKISIIKDIWNQILELEEADVVIRADEKEFSLSTFWLSDGDKPWRTQNYQARFTKEEMLADDFEENGLEWAKSYVGEFDNSQEAFKEILDFWFCETGGTNIGVAPSKKEAIELFEKGDGLEFIVIIPSLAEEKYYVTYNSMENAHDFGLLTKREVTFEEAIKEIYDDIPQEIKDCNLYKEEMVHLKEHLEVEIGNRFYRIVLKG